MPRSSIAAATAPPWRAGSASSTQICSGAAPPATRCSTSRATACAWARSLAQLQKRSSGSRKRCSSTTTSPSGWRSRNQSSASLVVLEREDLVRVVGGERAQQRPLGDRRLLQLVDHQVAEALGDLGAHVGALDQQALEREEDVAAVEAAGLGEDAVVGAEELGELELAAGRLALGLAARRLLGGPRPGAPARSARSPSALSASIRASSRASSPAGLPRISCRRSGSSSSRSSSIASRSARPSTSKNGSRPAASVCSRSSRSPIESQLPIQSSSKGPRSSASERSRRRRAVALVEPIISTRSGALGRGQVGEPPGEQLGLAGARRADHQQRTVAVGGDALAAAAHRRWMRLVHLPER